MMPAASSATELPRGVVPVEAIDDGQTTLLSASSDGPAPLLSSNFKRYFIDTVSNFVTVRGVPKSFSIGSAGKNWGIDVYTPRLSANGYHWGYVDGAGKVAKCVWVEAALLSPASQPPTRDCSTTDSLPPSRYMRYYNGNNLDENCWKDNKGQWRCDGSDILVSCPVGWNNGGSQFYANVQPWLELSGVATDNSGWISNGSIVKWRYVTKDLRFVMARVPWITQNVPNQQDWGFMPKACFPQLYSGVAPPS
jgi:hypothetical protein